MALTVYPPVRTTTCGLSGIRSSSCSGSELVHDPTAGTSSGTRLRAKGQGIKASGGGAGDLYAEIQIVIPKQFDEQSAALVRQLDERLKQPNPRADLEW